MPVEIFCCYARKDQPLLNELKAYLIPLERQGLIIVWADIDIGAGMEWEKEIEKHLDIAQIILLLISPDFMASDYCYSKEMLRAMERHQRGEAQIIPIILRPIYWQGASFGKLQALPTDAIPAMSSKWHNVDEAFFNIAEGIRKAVERLISKQPLPVPVQKVSLKAPILEQDPSTFNLRNLEGDYRNTLYQLFFADLLERLKSARPGITHAKKTQQQPFWWFGAGKTGFYFQWAFYRNMLRTELSINVPGKRDATKQAYDALYRQRADIEKEFGQSLVWDVRLERIESRISLLKQATIADPPDELEQTKIWAVETMLKLVDVFQKRIKTL